jgi:hypothetical protein
MKNNTFIPDSLNLAVFHDFELSLIVSALLLKQKELILKIKEMEDSNLAGSRRVDQERALNGELLNVSNLLKRFIG